MPITESLPDSAALWLENFVWDSSASIYAYSAGPSAYPASNLNLAQRSKKWRTSDVSGDKAVNWDLGSAKSPNCVAFANLNWPTGASDIKLQGADSSDLSTGLQTWTLGSFPQQSPSNILRWYLGADDSSVAMSAHRYWRFLLNGAPSDGYWELGSFWLGTYQAVTPSSNVDVRFQDPSSQVQSSGGAVYVDKQDAFRSIGINLDLLTFGEFYSLQNAVTPYFSKHVIFDLHASSAVEAIEKNSAFYGILDGRNPLRGRLKSSVQNSFSFKVIETRG